MAEKTVAFEEEVLPKSSAGRQAEPVNTQLVDAIAESLIANPTGELDGEQRPRTLGSKTNYETRGKASSRGSAYRKAVQEKVGAAWLVKVRVVALGGRNEKQEYVGPFRWRVYVVPATPSES